VTRMSLLLERREVVVGHDGKVNPASSAATRSVTSCGTGVCSHIAV
jgi:hypothetical protein